jgi:DNA-binding Lrp family transcriptional regulator
MTRQEDERLLDALTRRSRGQPVRAIARDLGIPYSTLNTQILRTVKEDCLCDPSAEKFWRNPT